MSHDCGSVDVVPLESLARASVTSEAGCGQQEAVPREGAWQMLHSEATQEISQVTG